MYVLDTNTLICFFKQQGQIAARLKTVEATRIAIPAIVLFELEYGILRSTKPEVQRQGLATVLSVYRVLDLTPASARCAAWVKHTLESMGTPIGHCDPLIAGIALAHQCTLVTRNTREFARVPGLLVENWYGD